MKTKKQLITMIIALGINIATGIIKYLTEIEINFTAWTIILVIESISGLIAAIMFIIIMFKYIKSKQEQERQEQVNIIAEAIKKAQTEEK